MALGVEILRIQPDLPVILMTGFSGSLTTEVANASGIHQLLIKPISSEAIGAAIQLAIRRGVLVC